MQPAPDLPTWRIISDGGSVFQWTFSGGGHPVRRSDVPEEDADADAPRLPSMEDLLFQGSSKLLEGPGEMPMFRTGSGKSVSVKQDSMKRAMSVLGEGEETVRGVVGGESLPMFRTGSGKSVAVKRSSMGKALAILEGDDWGKGEDSLPMFRTGTGKSVAVKQSSMGKALALLEGEDLGKDLKPTYTAHSGSMFSNFPFQTGSGKTVNVSSAGLKRAKTLLGLDASQTDEHTIKGRDNYMFNEQETSCHLEKGLGLNPELASAQSTGFLDTRSIPRCLTCTGDVSIFGNQRMNESPSRVFESGLHRSASINPQIKLQTAGGLAIQISDDALQRARSLLGESEIEVPHNERKGSYPNLSVLKENEYLHNTSSNEENVFLASLHKSSGMLENMESRIPLPAESSFKKRQLLLPAVNVNSCGDARNQITLNEFELADFWKSSHTSLERPSDAIYHSHSVVENLTTIPRGKSLAVPLADISNKINGSCPNHNNITDEKMGFRRRNTISPFKRPRNSRFVTPLNGSISSLASDSVILSTTEDSCHKSRVFTHYPFQVQRKTISEFFGGPPRPHDLEHLSDAVKCMDSVNAERYMFNAMSGSSMIKVEAFQHMLVQCGASVVNATREWVANHYRWIVWKLACLERGYATQAGGKFLNVSNVLEELKYRYEREINLGHRSAIKKILEGNASPASMLVLCISAIQSSPTADHETEQSVEICEGHENMARRGTHSRVAIIELTDGWYSLNTLLDVELSKQLCSGKLFVGQKLRIWGAGLAGWVGPVSPLEASESVKLTIHINGTYRASWDDRLGFCKSPSVPLAFWCIKGYGGQVPRTLVGVERIYPILYKERFSDGSSVVRTGRMENEVLHRHNQRRSDIIEGIMAEQQKENFGLHCQSNSDSEEGAKLFKILEKAAEPEVLMADMSSEQLNSFATYQAKQEEIRQADMQKKIERALEDACLSTRQVIPFMKVKVVGLTSLCSRRKGHLREGLITIWDPTEKLKGDLVEGQAYSVAGLVPSNSNPDIIYLQARGSATVWKPLSPVALKSFEPFFTKRKAVLLSSLGEVPLASEFDIAAVVVYVGEVYISGNQKKQWVFVTDGSAWGSDFSEEFYNSLLAISFCLSNADNYASAPVSHSLSGCIVGFSNLVKRARDQMNHLWVAEATENSTHTTCHNLSVNSHLKEAADIARKWAKDSVPSIQKLRERVLTIVGSSGS